MYFGLVWFGDVVFDFLVVFIDYFKLVKLVLYVVFFIEVKFIVESLVG
jgi:hypothetical protein